MFYLESYNLYVVNMSSALVIDADWTLVFLSLLYLDPLEL